MLAGAVTQSSVAVTSITFSMLKSELVSARQGFLIVTGSPLGVTLLILVVAFDIKLAAFYGLGVAGVIIFCTRKVHYREIGSMLFGVMLLVLGLILIKGELYRILPNRRKTLVPQEKPRHSRESGNLMAVNTWKYAGSQRRGFPLSRE